MCTTDRALSPIVPWRTSSIVAIVLGALATPAAAIPVTAGLVGYWAGDGDGLDSSSSANHLSLQNGAGFGPGMFDQAFQLDGVDDVATADAAALPTGSSDRTIAFWVSSPNMAVGNRMLMGWGAPAAGSMSAITLGYADQPDRKVFFWGHGSNDVRGVTPLADDTWHHVVFTLEGTLGSVYVDGALDASETLAGLDTTPGTMLYLGDFTSTMKAFEGAIDEAVVYDRALNPAEIASLAADPPRCAPQPVDCIRVGSASLTIKESKLGKEKLKLTLKKPLDPVPLGALGDPVNLLTRVDVCLYDENDTYVDELVVDRAGDLCGAKQKPCWKRLGDFGYGYKDPDASSSGVKKLVGKSSQRNGKLVVQAGNNTKKGQESMPTGLAAALDGAQSARVQLLASEAECFDVTLGNVKKSDGEQFRAKAP